MRSQEFSFNQVADIPAVAKSDSASPLIYLLTPSQMLDNDYRLPSYLDPDSDIRTIPGLDINDVSAELAALLRHKEERGEMTAVPESYSMASKNGTNGRQRLNDDGWVETPEATGPPPDGASGHYPILAMDCEMVRFSSSGPANPRWSPKTDKNWPESRSSISRRARMSLIIWSSQGSPCWIIGHSE